MLFFLGALLILFGFYAVVRIDAVTRERYRVLMAIHDRAEDDIAAGREWAWRYDAFWRVSHLRMVFSVRPVESFYDDADFLR